MPRPRHPLEEYVFTLIEENPGAGAETLRRMLEEQARQDLMRMGVEDSDRIGDWLRGLPTLSTIGRIKARYYREKSEDERAEYRFVRWPETFEAGILPWQASRDVLDLISRLAPFSRRPTVRFARWYWRLGFAAPDLDPRDRYQIAGALSASQIIGDRELLEMQRRMAEGWLADRAWVDRDSARRLRHARRTAGGREVHHRNVEEGVFPDGYPGIPWYPPGTPRDLVTLAFMETTPISEDQARAILAAFEESAGAERGNADGESEDRDDAA